MKILVCGGFLGSGKTTILNSVLAYLNKQGQSAAVIENEIGEFGIDDLLIQEAGVQVTPLFGGCICCQITGNLIVAIDQIFESIAPDWLVIEMTGAAEMTKMRRVFESYAVKHALLFVAVADCGRWQKLQQRLGSLMRAQLDGCDALILNKTDLTDQLDAIAAEAAVYAVKKPIFFFSKALDNRESIGRLLEIEPEAGKKQRPRFSGRLPDSMRVSGIYSTEIRIPLGAAVRLSALDGAIRRVMSRLGALFAEDDVLLGHIKSACKLPDGVYAIYSLTTLSAVDVTILDDWMYDRAIDVFDFRFSILLANESRDSIAARVQDFDVIQQIQQALADEL